MCFGNDILYKFSSWYFFVFFVFWLLILDTVDTFGFSDFLLIFKLFSFDFNAPFHTAQHQPHRLDYWTCSFPFLLFAVSLQILYKLKTAKIFDKPKRSTDSQDDDPFAIQMIFLCPESRRLCVAGTSHVMLFRFCKQELTLEVSVMFLLFLGGRGRGGGCCVRLLYFVNCFYDNYGLLDLKQSINQSITTITALISQVWFNHLVKRAPATF